MGVKRLALGRKSSNVAILAYTGTSNMGKVDKRLVLTCRFDKNLTMNFLIYGIPKQA